MKNKTFGRLTNALITILCTNSRWTFLVALIAVLFASSAGAITRHIDPAGTDHNFCGASIDPCQTIAHTVGLSLDNDELVLSAGTFSEQDILLDKPLTLVGAGATTIVDAQGAGRHFLVDATGEVTLQDLQLINGDATGDNGGSILVEAGSLLLLRAEFKNNTADEGGAVNCTASCTGLTIRRSTFTDNEATYGGALFTSADSVVKKTQFENNSSTALGGAIYNEGLTIEGPQLTVLDTQFNANETAGGGGAIYSRYAGATVRRSSFVMNTAGTGGGGISFSGDDGDLIVANVTFARNTGVYSGAISTGSNTTAKLSNITMKNNESDQGEQNFFAGGEFEMSNSIITNAPNFGGDFFEPSCAAALSITITGENNLMDKPCETLTSGTFWAGALSAGSLGGLGFYDGLTLTYPLLSGSNAIDSGVNNCPGPLNGTPLPYDQRNLPRPYGAACDVGAFERQIP